MTKREYLDISSNDETHRQLVGYKWPLYHVIFMFIVFVDVDSSTSPNSWFQRTERRLFFSSSRSLEIKMSAFWFSVTALNKKKNTSGISFRSGGMNTSKYKLGPVTINWGRGKDKETHVHGPRRVLVFNAVNQRYMVPTWQQDVVISK